MKAPLFITPPVDARCNTHTLTLHFQKYALKSLDCKKRRKEVSEKVILGNKSRVREPKRLG